MSRVSRQLALHCFACVLCLLMLPAWLWATPVHRQIGPRTMMLQRALPQAPQEVTGNVTGPDFSLSFGTLPDVIPRGRPLALTAIVASLGSYTGPVKLSILGDLPSNLTATFTPDTVTPLQSRPTWSATISSQLVIEAVLKPQVKTTAKNMPSQPGRRALAALPMLLLVPFAFARTMRRRVGPLLAVALLACLPLLSGCGEGRYPPTIASEAYFITVLATGANGLQHTVPLVIRVE